MIFTRQSERVSLRAFKWLVIYLVLNLLLVGSVIRLFLNKKFTNELILSREVLKELDLVLLYSFWGFFVVGLLFSLLFVKQFFSPLGLLISKARSIKKGDFGVRKKSYIKESRGEWYQLDLLLNKISKDLKRKKADIVKERGELEAVITAANDAILAIDKDMNIKYYNAPMALIFDQKEEASWGKKLTEVVRNQKIIEGFQQALEEQKSQWVEAQQELSVDSAVHFFKVSISPFLDEKKSRTRGAVAIFHDITDHKRVEKVRMDFVANASHELKTPLTSVQGYLSMIEDSCSDDKSMKEAFSVVQSNLRRLDKIILDLLELSKIESAESSLKQKIDVLHATEEVVHNLQGMVKEKEQVLVFNYEVEEVFANNDLLNHVLTNLIENASKYSPKGATIKVRWGESKGATFLSVKDNGPGIESYHQGRLFERFYRVRDEKNMSTRGTGLGLSIVRNCMQKMNGQIDLKSAPGLGSEFLCYFPKK